MRPSSDSDGATPAASGLAVLALVRLAELTGRADFAEIVDAVIEREGPVAGRAPIYLPTFVRAAALREAQLGVRASFSAPRVTRAPRRWPRARGCCSAPRTPWS